MEITEQLTQLLEVSLWLLSVQEIFYRACIFPVIRRNLYFP